MKGGDGGDWAEKYEEDFGDLDTDGLAGTKIVGLKADPDDWESWESDFDWEDLQGDCFHILNACPSTGGTRPSTLSSTHTLHKSEATPSTHAQPSSGNRSSSSTLNLEHETFCHSKMGDKLPAPKLLELQETRSLWRSRCKCRTTPGREAPRSWRPDPWDLPRWSSLPLSAESSRFLPFKTPR